MESSFDWLSLDRDENVLWEGKPIMKSIYPAILVGVPLIPVGIGIIIIAAAYLHKENTEFVVTSQGLYKKTGVLSRRVKNIGFDKVQDISFNQGIFGKKFGYGNIGISTAGGQNVEMRFNSIDSPKQVQELINKRIRSKEKGSEELDDEKVLKSILKELKATRKSVERIEEKV